MRIAHSAIGPELEFVENHRNQHLTVPIGLLDRRKLETIVHALEKRAPSCKIDPHITAHAFPIKERPTSANEEEQLVIHYQTHEKLRQFFNSVKMHEKYFWRVWLTVCLLPLLLFSPYLIWHGYSLLTSTPVASIPPWLSAGYEIIGRIMQYVSYALSNSTGYYMQVVSHPVATLALLAAVMLAILKLAQFLAQPNIILAGPQGMRINLQLFNQILNSKKIEWSAITSICSEASEISQSADSHTIIITENTASIKNRKTILKLSALKERERQKLSTAFKRWAPSAARDSQLLEALMPQQPKSYTELWLQSLATPPKRTRLAPLENGQLLRDGRYRIDKTLGVGGQGVAYLAYNLDSSDSPGHSHSIALKEFILPVYVDKLVRKQSLESFEHEARILQSLNHPQIVKMLDYFIEDHRGYLALEHIDGFSLRAIVEENISDEMMAQEQILDLALQMCKILEYLHGLSPPVVHRDFTPDNLILNKDGVLKLIDFNVAQQHESKTSATVVGKHAYLPPEQFRGRPSVQSDIYALGATLYFLVTGKNPEPLTSSHPLLCRDTIDPKLDQIIANCTQLDLKKRYASAEHIAKDLGALSAGSERISVASIDVEPKKKAALFARNRRQDNG